MQMIRFSSLRSRNGNVVIELVFSITLMAAIAVPAITALATVVTARNYAENAAVSLARTWTISTVTERDQAILDMRNGLILKSPYPLTLSTKCVPDCQSSGAVIEVTSRIVTSIPWIGIMQFKYELEANKYAP
jgi:hypothetical protein